MEFSSSITKENLMRAFAGESQARNRYTFAADAAKQQKYEFISRVFKLTAAQEKVHAEIFYNFLKQLNGENIAVDGAYPVDNYDDITKLLLSAQHNEYEESETVYPAFAKTASEEGFTQIAAAFGNIAKIEKVHGDRFGTFASLIANGLLYKSDCAPSADTEWLCLNCGHIHKGPSAPANCPVCHADRGFFVPFKYYDFKEEGYAN